MTGSRRREDGFTLVEVIVSMAISSIVIGALATTLIVSLKVNDQTDARVRQSRDAQLASLYFTRDAQSMTSLITAAASFGCPVSGSTFVIGMQFVDGSAAYYQRGSELVRQRCTASGTTGAISVVARNLTTSVPTVVCPTTVDPLALCTATSREVRMTVRAQASATLPTFAFTLAGSRRTT